jgi:murein L,D-transpeptidase YcbB/YkuD
MAQRQPRPELTTQSIAILDDGPPLRQPGPFANPRLEGDILANMERWRWLPAEFGARYLSVNVPEYRLRLYEEGRVAHESRVIAGKVDTPTPIFSGLMEYAIVNPSWHVPPSILKNEFLPRMAEDPTYATRQGYEVVRRGDAISIRQPPGEKNALGFIKFMFPNKHAVYLHDTPNRRLFANSKRALSHGCVRVENPFVLADFVLGSEWTETRLKRLIGRGRAHDLAQDKLPVHLTYFTLAVDERGRALQAFDDIYGHDRRVRSALGLAG